MTLPLWYKGFLSGGDGMKNYEINSKTLAILPFGKHKTIVYEDHDCFILETKTPKIMDNSCRFYGSSMQGRQQGTATLTGLTYKVPIIISEENNIIFFPTSSPRLKDCAWISLNNVNRYFAKDNQILIEFMNKETLELPISYNILNNQILKASKLESSIRKRIHHN